MDSNMCRTCLGKHNLQSIYDIVDDIKLSNKVMFFASIEISEDDLLPDFICKKCIQKLNKCYKFKTQCEVSDNKLRNYINNATDKSSKENGNNKKVKKRKYSSNTSENNDNKVNEEIEYKSIDDINDGGIYDNKGNLSSNVDEYNCHEDSEINRNRSDPIEAEIKVKNDSCEKDMVNEKKQKIKNSLQCYNCGKIVSTKFRLKCHMRTHTGEKPYKCKECDKTFALAYNLKVHERIHSGEKPLVCRICGKSFAQSAGLITHARLHTGETPYKCTICPMKFKTCSHLQYHIRLHTGEKQFHCSMCDRSFITKSDLKQHYNTHTGERNHVCTVCGVRLTRAYHLTRHMLTHTGVKNFKCDICGNAYAQKGDMVRHMRQKHTSQSNVPQVKTTSAYLPAVEPPSFICIEQRIAPEESGQLHIIDNVLYNDSQGQY